MELTLDELESQTGDDPSEGVLEAKGKKGKKKVRDPRGVLPDIFRPGHPLVGPSARDRSRFPEKKYKIKAKEINYVRRILDEYYALGGYPRYKGRRKSSAGKIAWSRLDKQQDRTKILTAQRWVEWALTHNAVVDGTRKLDKRVLGILKSGKRRKNSFFYFNMTRDGKRIVRRQPAYGKKHFSPRSKNIKSTLAPIIDPFRSGLGAIASAGSALGALAGVPTPKTKKTKARRPKYSEALRYILNFRPDPSHPKYGDRTGRYRGVNLSPGTREQVKKLQAAANKVIEKRYKGWEKIEEDGIWGMRSYKYIRKIISDYSSGERRVIRIVQNAENWAYRATSDMEQGAEKTRLWIHYRMNYLDARIRPQDMKYLPQPSWANHSNQAYKDLWERFSWATAAKLKKYRKETPMEKTKRDSRGRRIGGLKIPEKFRWMTRASPHDIPTQQEYQASKQYCTGRHTYGCLKLFRPTVDSLCKNRPGEMPAGVCDDWELWKKREKKTTPKKPKKPSRAQLVAKAPKKPKGQAAKVSKAPKKQKGEKAAVYIPDPGMSFSKAYWAARRKGYLKVQVPGKRYSIYTRLKGETSAAWKKKMCRLNPDCYVPADKKRAVAKAVTPRKRTVSKPKQSRVAAVTRKEKPMPPMTPKSPAENREDWGGWD